MILEKLEYNSAMHMTKKDLEDVCIERIANGIKKLKP